MVVGERAEEREKNTFVVWAPARLVEMAACMGWGREGGGGVEA